MSDNCNTMGPVLEDACSQGQAMPNAAAFICVYHLERNFHADFGVSSRGRLSLKPSRMRKKKGATLIGHTAGKNNASMQYTRCKNARVLQN